MCAKQIRVVDDEPIVGEAIRLTLEPAGHAIEVVTSPHEALTRFERGRYDVILTDFRMEGMTGLEMAEQIKARDPAQPIILVSGSPPFPAPTAVDLVPLKPFDILELNEAVVELTGRRTVNGDGQQV